MLDDAPDITESICADLRDMGFFAEPFLSIESVRTALQTNRFDAFIIDLMIGRNAARNIIGSHTGRRPALPDRDPDWSTR